MPLDTTTSTALTPANSLLMPDNSPLRKLEFWLRVAGVLLKHNALILFREALVSRLRGRELNTLGLAGDFAAQADRLWRAYKGFQLSRSGSFSKLESDKRGIVISNHPEDDALWSWLHVVTDEFSPNFVSVMKDEFLTKPKYMAIGWPAYLGGMGVPIDRSKGASALTVIRDSCDTLFTPGKSMSIFPCGTRPSHDKIAASQKRMMRDRPDLNVNEWLHNTPFPRSGGLMSMLKTTADHPVQILNTTVGLSVDCEEGDVQDATVYVHGEEVSREELLGSNPDESAQRESLDNWLVEEWKRKNEMRASWRQGVENILETD